MILPALLISDLVYLGTSHLFLSFIETSSLICLINKSILSISIVSLIKREFIIFIGFIVFCIIMLLLDCIFCEFTYIYSLIFELLNTNY